MNLHKDAEQTQVTPTHIHYKINGTENISVQKAGDIGAVVADIIKETDGIEVMIIAVNEPIRLIVQREGAGDVKG